MTWADFYLICFLLGLGLSLLSVLTGSAHLHLPHLHRRARDHTEALMRIGRWLARECRPGQHIPIRVGP